MSRKSQRRLAKPRRQLLRIVPDATVRYSRADLPPDDTDWQRVDALTDEQVHAAALADPDARPTTPAFWHDAQVVHPLPKESITIRVDRDVVDWFRAEGRGYQARINAVLRAFVDQERGRTG